MQLLISDNVSSYVRKNAIDSLLIPASTWADGIPNYTQKNAIDSLVFPAAIWTDISNRATWASSNLLAGSGSINLNDFAEKNRPIWLAFKYTAAPFVTQKRWTISAITLNNYSKFGFNTILTPAIVLPTLFPVALPVVVSQGWGTICSKGSMVFAPDVYTGGSNGFSKASSSKTASFQVWGNRSTTDTLGVESWIISGPIDLSRVIHSVGVPVKNKSENAMMVHRGVVASLNGNYTYQFRTKGVYEVVFEASNNSIEGVKTITKSIILTVK
jgi:hypothetical protein